MATGRDAGRGGALWPRRVERKRAQLALCCTKTNVVLTEAVFRTTAPARGHAPRRREAMDDRPLKRVRSWKIIYDEALRLAVDDPPSELERTRKELEATRAKLARTEATLKTTEATLALKTKVVDSFLRPQPVAFDVDGNVACVVLSHVSDVKTRLALAQVGKVWRRASKEAASLPASLDFSRCSGSMYMKEMHVLDINGLDKLPEARFMSLLRDDMGSRDTYQYLLGRYHGRASRYEEAAECFKSALAAGDRDAKCRLGGCYYLLGCRYHAEPNDIKAVEVWRKGEALGYSYSLCYFQLGNCYEMGHGVAKDMFKAVEYWKKTTVEGIPSIVARAKEKLASYGHRI
eukprot:29612-Pelagococcus_subviridis.AAC.4